MAVINGKGGTLTVAAAEEAEVGRWTAELTSDNKSRVTNDTDGYTKRTAGAKDQTGSFEMKDLPTFDEGDDIALVLYTGQDIYTWASVLVSKVTPNCNIEGSEDVTFAVEWGANGSYTKSAGSAP